jgi:hypothetical protein
MRRNFFFGFLRSFVDSQGIDRAVVRFGHSRRTENICRMHAVFWEKAEGGTHK